MKDNLFRIFNEVICAIAIAVILVIIPKWYYGNLSAALSICIIFISAVVAIYSGFIVGCYEAREIRREERNR